MDFAFAPAQLTITAGDTVTWTNLDAVAHTATATAGAFDSGDLEQGESYSVTFSTPGTYDYRCTPHSSMTGRIVVVAAAAIPTAPPPPMATPVPGASGALPDVAMPRPARDRTPILGLALVMLGVATAATAATATVRVRRRR